MNQYGSLFVAAGLLALAFFPLFIYAFFRFVILDLKGKAVVTDLSARGAFEMKSVIWNKEEDVLTEVQKLYGSQRFIWPVLFGVFFNLICFSMVWDIVEGRWAYDHQGGTCFYNGNFLAAAELPIVAFVGVTIFNYGHMLRRLYLWDLTPHVFWNAVYRVWLVFAVAIVASSTTTLLGKPDSSMYRFTYMAFFFLGFIINSTVLKFIERSQQYFHAKRARAEELPLSLIQGISFWHEYRLEEEGIENVQNLATCDVLELALNTRYNLRTLLDWVDQAILVHRLGQQALVLRKKGLISGAIDMAWASPQNSGGETELPKQVAETLGTSRVYVSALMDSLFEDAYVLMLWDLWQSKEHSQKKRKTS